MKGYFQKYLDHRCTEKEFRSFLDLFIQAGNQQVLDENMKEDWDRNSTGDVPDLSETLYKIHYEINRQEGKRPKVRRLTDQLTRIAAVLLIPLAVAYFFLLQKNEQAPEILQTISTPLASKTSFELPDGSTVWLNSGSSVSFPRDFKGDVRWIQLKGEAYFDVTKSKHPFQVRTPLFTVNVLGTAFNVMSYDHEVPAITLERGKILLETRSKRHKTLIPGQQAVIDTVSQAITLKKVDASLFSSWIRNQLIFKNEPLGTVVNRLERWYNIDIDVADKSLLKIPMTASIEFESIHEVMELMKLTLPVNYVYKKDNRQLIIYKRND